MSEQQAKDAQETFVALDVILADDAMFQTVVHTVHRQMDVNGNGKLECEELQSFLHRFCDSMGVKDPPTAYQVAHVYRHLDLNGDGGVSVDELAVFLKHFFTEQHRQAKEKMKKIEQETQKHPAEKPQSSVGKWPSSKPQGSQTSSSPGG